MDSEKGETFAGGCHCGAIRFQVVIRRQTLIDCNCSICQKKGFLHLIVPAADFTLLRGESDLSFYLFNTQRAKHIFCRHCGIHSFYIPRSHPDCFDVNFRCLDAVSLADFTVELFDGRHWEAYIDQLTEAMDGGIN